MTERIACNLNEFKDLCYNEALEKGWHTEADGSLKNMNKGQMLMLIVSEVAEAMEGERKGLMDDHLPKRPMAEVEMADTLIRIMDYCGRWNYDIGGAVMEKMQYNRNREDHKPENRNKENGKKY